MISHFIKRIAPFSRVTLILEGITLFLISLAFAADHLMDQTGSPPQSAVTGALLLFIAVCVSIVAAVTLIINVFRNRIDLGTIISAVPFIGFAIWGIWYSYTEPTWARNVSLYWAIFAIIIVFWLYVIIKYKNNH